MIKFKRSMAILSAMLITTMALTLLLSACTPKAELSDEYGVTVNYNEEFTHANTVPRTYYVEKGKSLDSIEVPVTAGYCFEKWTSDKEGKNVVTFPLTPTQDMTIYAQWGAQMLNVTFDFTEANAESIVVNVEYGYTVTAPLQTQIPEYAGHIFREWRLENGKSVDFTAPVRTNVTYYAAWLANDIAIWTVNFDANYTNADAIDPISVVDGEDFDVDSVPRLTRPGYKFKGWAYSADATANNIIDMSEFKVASNLTLYAVWEVETYTITFRKNLPGAEAVEDRIKRFTVRSDEDVTPPENPVREGFTFAGWYEVAKGGEEVVFPAKVTASKTYYAHWKAYEVSPENNIFEAEYTYFNPLEDFPGYSGGVKGSSAIVNDIVNQYDSHNGYHVSYLFKQGAKLTFVINSDKAVDGVKLYAKLGAEMSLGVTLTKEGAYGYRFVVNGTDVDYGSITLPNTPVDPNAKPQKTKLVEYFIGTVSLKEGENIIELITNNATAPGGTMTSTAPTVDYIRLETSGATLKWSPELDNL